jgi:hypothetical protein
MAPLNTRENVEGIAVELENSFPAAEKSISYDPALASAADTQQLGTFGFVYTNANDAHCPARWKIVKRF